MLPTLAKALAWKTKYLGMHLMHWTRNWQYQYTPEDQDWTDLMEDQAYQVCKCQGPNCRRYYMRRLLNLPHRNRRFRLVPIDHVWIANVKHHHWRMLSRQTVHWPSRHARSPQATGTKTRATTPMFALCTCLTSSCNNVITATVNTYVC